MSGFGVPPQGPQQQPGGPFDYAPAPPPGYPGYPAPATTGHPGAPGYPAPSGYSGAPGYPAPARPGSAPPQRPAIVTLASVLTVTAGLQVFCLVGFVWLFLRAASGALDPSSTSSGPGYHLLARADLALAGGLWLPLLGFPIVAAGLGLWILARSAPARLALTATGVAAVAWMLFWPGLSRSLVAAPVFYIVLVCVLLWLPPAGRWYRGTDDADLGPRPQ